MIWAMGALLLQFQAVPQVVVPTASSMAALEAAAAPASDDNSSERAASTARTRIAYEPGRLVPTPVAAAGSLAAELPAPAASPVIAVSPRPAEFAGRITGGPQKLWLGLAVAQHGAATFDAWTTRRAINRGAQELNPMLKPFAGNNSIYAAVQVAPTLLDYVGRRMMTSRHSVLRHTWWLPQVLGTAASLAGGVHNLGVH